MVAKLIKVYLKSGHAEAYLAAQRVWNAETRKAEGYCGHACGADPREPGVFWCMFFWRSREDLERWMGTEHDRIAALAGADAHYDSIETRVLDIGNDVRMPGKL